MRTPGIIIIALMMLAGCKTASVTSSKEAYKEDLRHLRPSLNADAPEDREEAVDSVSVYAEPTGYQGHLKAELDSVNKIILAKNMAQKYVDGYTIQIYTGNDRDAATDAKNRVTLLNPDFEPVISYHQPTYKVKVGQYTDRLQAHTVFQAIKKEFPLALLIPERIPVSYE